MINIVVAYDPNRLIGNGNDLPWPSIKEDFKHFKETTMSFPIVMGRKTWESLPKKPLSGRKNIVVTHNPIKFMINNNDENIIATCFKYMDETLEEEKSDVYVIGGAQIYKEFLDRNLINKIIASEIKQSYKGDVFFPEIDKDQWEQKIVKEFSEFNVVEYTNKRT